MSLLDKVIKESVVLSLLSADEDFKNISAQKFNEYFNGTNKPHVRDIIFKLISIYEGKYPNFDIMSTNEVFNLIRGIHSLETIKIKDLLVLLHFYKYKEVILEHLDVYINDDYNNIKILGNLKDTLISLDLVDLLRTRGYTFTAQDLVLACKYGSLNVVKYIIDKQYDINYQYNPKRNPYDDNIAVHIYNEELFQNACNSGNLELVQYLWDLPKKTQIDVNKINVSNLPKNISLWFKENFPEFYNKIILEDIIFDSDVLSNQRKNFPEEFEGLTLQTLNSWFYLTDHQNVIDRVAPIYDGKYPTTVDEYIQTIKDLDFLQSYSKINDVFRLLRSFNRKNEVLDQLNDYIVFRYNQSE